MKRHRVRSALLTGLVLVSAGILWLYFAPPQIGGSTNYVVTHGVSMEPRFHTGDLAVVRPAGRYRVGDVVAYRSSLLHIVVLHRIVAIRDGRYTFKGDNNDFLDPVHPTRAELIGKLWLRIPHGGVVTGYLHTPLTAGVLAGCAGWLLLGGFGETRRRRNRRQRRAAGAQGAPPMTAKGQELLGPVNLRALLTGVATAAVVLFAIVVLAFTRPLDKPTTHAFPYTQAARFGYRASAPAGPVYPSGIVSTGDPIFLQLVHQLGVSMVYRLTSASPPAVHGTVQVLLNLSGPTGWSRTMPLTSVTPFSGDRVRTSASLNLESLQELFNQVEKETGIATSGDTIAITAKVRVRGLIAGQPITTSFAPALTFQLGDLQLQMGGGSSTAGSTQSGLNPTQHGQVATAATVGNVLTVLGVSVPVGTLRFLASVGFLFTLAGALALTVLVARGEAFGESARIKAKYGHMIVPINAGKDLGWPAIDVSSMKSLVRLAETSGQLILHNHGDDADTYLVNDEGSVYRYQVQLPKVLWGEWTSSTTELAA